MNKTKQILLDIKALISKNMESKENRLNTGLLDGDFGKVLFLYLYSSIENNSKYLADHYLNLIMHNINKSIPLGTYCSVLVLPDSE